MGIREITGYIAHVLLAGYWLWVILSTAPQLRRGARDQRVRTQVLLIKTAAVVLTALLVGVIHFWATHWWQVIARCRSRPGSGCCCTGPTAGWSRCPGTGATLTRRARTFERGGTCTGPRARTAGSRAALFATPRRSASGRRPGRGAPAWLCRVLAHGEHVRPRRAAATATARQRSRA